MDVAHRARVGAPTLTQDTICSGTAAEQVGKNLLCTAFLGYPTPISGALGRAKIVSAQPRPAAELDIRVQQLVGDLANGAGPDALCKTNEIAVWILHRKLAHSHFVMAIRCPLWRA